MRLVDIKSATTCVTHPVNSSCCHSNTVPARVPGVPCSTLALLRQLCKLERGCWGGMHLYDGAASFTSSYEAIFDRGRVFLALHASESQATGCIGFDQAYCGAQCRHGRRTLPPCSVVSNTNFRRRHSSRNAGARLYGRPSLIPSAHALSGQQLLQLLLAACCTA